MARTKIEWADVVWNPITGCTPVSEGCENCYAKRMAKRLAGRFGYPKHDPFRVTFHPERLKKPLKWKKSRRIFVCSMGDLFHKLVRKVWLDAIFDIMKLCPQHTFIILTKRPQNIEPMLYDSNILGGGDYLPNVHWGVSVENQQRADERTPIILRIPAAKRIVNIEPMLGPINILKYRKQLDGVMLGGESGPGARPMHPDWVRSVRDQCVKAGVPFFFKQWGEWIAAIIGKNQFSPFGQYSWQCGTLDINGNWFLETTPWNGLQGDASKTKEYIMYKVGKKQAGRLLDGREWNELP